MNKVFLILSLTVISLWGGYIGKGGLYDYKLLFQSDKDGGYVYRIYCVDKNSMFSISNHRVFKKIKNEWYDGLMDISNPKYMGMTYDNLDVKSFGEKVCK